MARPFLGGVRAQRLFLFAPIAAVLLSHSQAHALQLIPSLSKVAVGLNFFASSPDGSSESGVDPALKTLPVFNFSSFAAGRTWGGVYAVPDVVSFRPSPACSYSSEVDVVRSSLGFMQSMHAWAITKERVLWWTHTDDKEYHEVSTQTLDSSFVCVRAKASCTAYEVGVDSWALTPASLSVDFVSDVLSLLPTSYPTDAAGLLPLRLFVDTWGTSHLASAVLGGSASIVTTFTQENYTALEHVDTDMAIGAGLGFLAAFGDQSLAQDKNYDSYKQFASSSVSEAVLFVGPRPPGNASDARMNATTWAADILLPAGSPEVVSYVAAPLADLVARAALFPGQSAADMAGRASSLATFISGGDYCAVAATPCVSFTRNSFWSDGPALPFPLRSSAIAGDGVHVYAVGGALTTDTSTAISGTLYLDSAAPDPQWVQLPPPFFSANASAQGGLAMASAALNTSDGSVWVVGGVNSAGALQAGISRFDATSRTWHVQGGIATARTSHCTVLVGGQLFVIGGADAHGAPMGSVEIYNPAQGESVPGSPLPVALAGHACTLLAGEIWVWGGASATAPATDGVFVYTPATDVWRAGPSPLLQPRSMHAASLVNDTVLIVGGVDATGAAVGAVLAFNTSSGVGGGWTLAPPLPRPVIASCATTVYEAHSDARIVSEGPDNGGFIIIVLGGAGSTAGGQTALASTQRMKIFDSHGSYRFVPASAAAIDALRAHAGGSAAEQLARMRASPAAGIVESQRLSEIAAVPPPASAGALPIYGGVDYLSHSYNPILATPGAQRDAGWLPTGPFQVACPSCFKQGKMLNGFAIPDGVSVRELSAASCDYTASSLTMRSAAEVQAALSLFVELDAGLFNLGALLSEAFSLGASVSATATATASINTSFVTSTSHCTLFEASIDAYDFTPAFNPSFVAAVDALPLSLDDPSPWLDFIETFGIAYVTRASLGGSASEVNVLTAEAFNAYLSVDANVDSKSSSSFFFLFGGSADTGGAFAFNEWVDLASSTAVNTTACSPMCPPVTPDGVRNASAWRAAVASQPVPISFSLAPLWTLLGPNASAPASAAPRSLAAWALERGELARAERFAGAADLLASFVTSGEYCSLLVGCSSLGGRPQWGRPELPSARWVPNPVTAAAGGLLPRAGGGNASVIVLAGGVTGSDPHGQPSSAVALFDTAAPLLGWLAAQPLPAPRAGAASVVALGALWVIGGVAAAGSTAPAVVNVSSFALSALGGSWLPRPSLPAPLTQHAAVVVATPPAARGTGPLVCVFGGCSDAACASPSQAIYCLDAGAPAPAWVPSSHTLPSGPAWGLAAVASADGASIYVAGGATAYAPGGTPYLYVYSVAADDWLLLETTAAPLPFYSAAALLVPGSGRLLVLGGVVTDPTRTPPTAPSAAVWSYDGARKEWEAWEPAPWPVAGGVAVWLPGGPPCAAAAGGLAPLAHVNASAPALWLIGGGGGSGGGVAQLRNLPAGGL